MSAMLWTGLSYPTMVGKAGFEPTALAPQTRCSTRLSYFPKSELLSRAPTRLAISPPLYWLSLAHHQHGGMKPWVNHIVNGEPGRDRTCDT